MDFKGWALEHLSDYKERVLHTTKSGCFGGKEYSHILCEEERIKNLFLLPSDSYKIKDNSLFFTKIEHKPIKLHPSWYHLNSSQILCISYFYKFIENPELLQKFCKAYSFGEPCGAEFEYVAKDGTNVDFTIHLKNGGHVFFEVKYTEQAFGNASLYRTGKSVEEVKEIYRKRYEKFYSNVKISEQDYLHHYQVVRNMSLAHKDSQNTMIFLFHSRNQNVLKSLTDGRNSVINKLDFRDYLLDFSELLSTKAFGNEGVLKKYFEF